MGSNPSRITSHVEPIPKYDFDYFVIGNSFLNK